MLIEDFIARFNNHPVLFIGSGLSFRYLKDSYRWDDLLKKIAFDFTENNEYYYDLKSKYQDADGFRYDKIATQLEQDFNEHLKNDRHGKFEEINDIFYKNMEQDLNVSRFKLYIAHILKDLNYKETPELTEFKKTRKNISSVITTNYDTMIEDLFSFNPLIGNDILLSNPYGSLYKIHGCITQPNKIIITEQDYKRFELKYELIRAQLLSLFIHNPIIFLGYSLSDRNIKHILKTIFTYVDPQSEQAEKIRSNFLLVEYDPGSNNREVTEHDIDLEGFSTIRINKIKTDDYISIYRALASLVLPVSAMDIRKVQSVVKEIYSGGDIKVMITGDLDHMKNSDKVVAIGSMHTITYVHQNSIEFIKGYFEIIDEENKQILELIDKIKIQKQQYFPIFGFSKINNQIKCAESLKNQQVEKLKSVVQKSKSILKNKKLKEEDLNAERILNGGIVSDSDKYKVLGYAALKGKVTAEELKDTLEHLKSEIDSSQQPSIRVNYKLLLCVYDYLNYGQENIFTD